MTPTPSALANAIAPIHELGVLLCSGPDARSFLHGQLTNDFLLLDHTQARLAAFLSAKGRMQASFIGIRHGEADVLLLVHRSVLAAVQKRLSMFVLRAKAKLSDASADWQLQALFGDAVRAQVGAALAPWQLQAAADGSLAIGLYPAAGLPRALRLRPAATDAAKSGTDGATSVPEAAWQWSEVASGVATISAPVVDLLVPQMLNYESIGGINFKKGCYPGQEVVARSQFRGAIKRRALLARGAAAALPQPGDEVFGAGDDEQPCGLVVQVAAHWPADTDANGLTRFDAIVSLQTAHAGEALHIRPAAAGMPPDGAAPAASAAHGAHAATPVAIDVHAAPYPLLDDI
ncbi:folate-binding protein [Corticibacter populi]|uniref:Folate-binding protein n=1 Tax=Corticibacter populi TaxID=1550736 RepID=A0A3M6QZY4_9BURK|nr:folate-binding protein YgfZ [Corticibacter populi]RMX08473.1 folate-binding protein [Corticibacter populi]